MRFNEAIVDQVDSVDQMDEFFRNQASSSSRDARADLQRTHWSKTLMRIGLGEAPKEVASSQSLLAMTAQKRSSIKNFGTRQIARNDPPVHAGLHAFI
jgi:hypothetical protein